MREGGTIEVILRRLHALCGGYLGKGYHTNSVGVYSRKRAPHTFSGHCRKGQTHKHFAEDITGRIHILGGGYSGKGEPLR